MLTESPFEAGVLGLFVAITIALILLVALRPRMIESTGGRAVIFVALLVLPVLVTALGTSAHLEYATSTTFCLSCHVMEPYGESLLIDSGEHVPAVHVQNALTPRDHACFACHTSYTMFGDLQAKLRGLRHVWVNYLGEVPEKIALYEPYQNRECLSCHRDARSFAENEMHVELEAELDSGETSCLDCHEQIHDVEHLDSLPKWREAAP